jgi:hypothetical protein
MANVYSSWTHQKSQAARIAAASRSAWRLPMWRARPAVSGSSIHRCFEVTEIRLDGHQPGVFAQLGHFGVRPDRRSGSIAAGRATLGPERMAGHDHQNVARWRRRGVQVAHDTAVHITVSVDGDGGEQHRYDATGRDSVSQRHTGFRPPHDELAGAGVDRRAAGPGRPGDTVEDVEQAEVVVFGERGRCFPHRGADRSQRLPRIGGEGGLARRTQEAFLARRQDGEVEASDKSTPVSRSPASRPVCQATPTVPPPPRTTVRVGEPFP